MNNKDTVIGYWLNVKHKEKEGTTEMGLRAQPPATGKKRYTNSNNNFRKAS